MLPDSLQQQAAYEPRVGMGLKSAAQGGLTGNSGVLAMTEAEFAVLENLKQNLAILEEKLQPILETVPTNGVEGNKMAELNMNKVSGRLMSIFEITSNINRTVEQLNREINL